MKRTRLAKIILVLVTVEAITIGILVAYTRFEIREEKSQVLMNSILAARFMALVPTEYTKSFSQSLFDTGYSSLQSILAGERTAAPDIGSEGGTYHTVFVKRLEDLPKKIPPSIQRVLDKRDPFVISENMRSVSVIVPLYNKGESSPYGILRLESEIGHLQTMVLRKNAPLYLLIIFLINGQAIAVLAIVFRKSPPIQFERGYLREHALGALKLQHKILGDIIVDHENIGTIDSKNKNANTEEVTTEGKSDSENNRIIPLPKID